ncbi:hypothetical protein SS50377_28356 [Spironucleus salmonicida]|uniref:Uncharacterized protein n=1 Tax=Spironucleus salmonicida TaxID=348837 RepID=V6LI81_9EUKA|nr:hypothetical protein SS50377_28356 [Spironucleus salmonicida]|eukprot:EST44285.1 Hypothetical protein SS50377_15888 [Spironucleus salmonicida]
MTFITNIKYHQSRTQQNALELIHVQALFPAFLPKAPYITPPQPNFRSQQRIKFTQIRERISRPVMSSHSSTPSKFLIGKLDLNTYQTGSDKVQKQTQRQQNYNDFDGPALLKILSGGVKNENNEQMKQYVAGSKQQVMNSYGAWRRATNNAKFDYIENTFKILNE